MIEVKVAAIVQTRMGSTRLPGKVMLKVQDKTVLEHVITRLKQAKEIDEIVIATTTEQQDDLIVNEAQKLEVKYFRGSEEDVLSRYYYAAKENNVDIVVRITSDCPLIDPKIVDYVVQCYRNNEYDLVTNAGVDSLKRTYPRGLDVAVFSFDVLEDSFINAKEQYHREHVTPYIYENGKIYYFQNSINYSYHRWTLDTNEDFELIKNIYNELYTEEHKFYMHDIIRLFEEQPELIKINGHIEQKKVIEL